MKMTFLAAAFAACAPVVFAQSTPENGPPAVLQITREGVKEGKGAAHRKVEQDYANAFRRNKFPFHYLGLTAESGPNEAWFLAAYPSFAAMEEGDKLSQKTPLKNDLELAEGRDGELRSESRSMTAVFRKDLSYMPANALPVGKFRYMEIANYRVRLGQSEAFMAGAKIILDGYRKANIDQSIICYQVISGAPNGVFLFLIPMDSLKQMDKGMANDKALADAVGADVMTRFRKGEGEIFQNMESTLFAVSPEMSYLTKEDEEADASFWRPKVTAARATKETVAAKETAAK
ncbi:MAG TPA: hypothetical protein VG096_01290 [Bryobacteraceae bacterium]|jgi:hypothetical protein|nr:hypothetical protein [Bryobacteraceae bacterium]